MICAVSSRTPAVAPVKEPFLALPQGLDQGHGEGMMHAAESTWTTYPVDPVCQASGHHNEGAGEQGGDGDGSFNAQQPLVRGIAVNADGGRQCGRRTPMPHS